MAFFATEEDLPAAARVWKKNPPKPPVPPVKPPKPGGQPPPWHLHRPTVYWKCGEDRWLARNPKTNKFMYVCDQFFIDLKKSGFYEKEATIKGKKVSKVTPNVLVQNASKSTRGKTFKKAPDKVTIDENVANL